MLGALMSLLASAGFGINDVLVRRGVLTGSPLHALAISMPLGVAIFALATLVGGQWTALGEMSWRGVMWLALAGIVHFIIGRYCNYRALQAIGANLAGPVQGMSILVSLVFALAFLGETLDWLKVTGIMLMILGPGLIIRRPPKIPAASAAGTARPAFEPRYVEGYLFALMSAFGYGISPVLIRAGLTQPDSALAGGFVSYVAALIILTPVFVIPSELIRLIAIDRPAAKWFGISGVTVCLAQLFRYIALGIAPVVVVAPIMRLTTVFRVVLGWVFNREHESFDPRVLTGIGISLIGALALTVDAGWLADALGLPLWIAEDISIFPQS